MSEENKPSPPPLTDVSDTPSVPFPYQVVLGEPLKEGIPLATKEEIIAAISAVQDPELMLNVYELGLIYEIKQETNGNVKIIMTLTAPTCPMAGEIPSWVASAVMSVIGVGIVTVELTFDPPWTLDRLSEDIKIAMGIN